MISDSIRRWKGTIKNGQSDSTLVETLAIEKTNLRIMHRLSAGRGLTEDSIEVTNATIHPSHSEMMPILICGRDLYIPLVNDATAVEAT
jgi:hypothetical protein